MALFSFTNAQSPIKSMGAKRMRVFIQLLSSVRSCVPLLFLLQLLLTGCLNDNSTRSNEKEPALSMTGTHHMGANFTVSDYYINGDAGGNIGQGGGGGSKTCCTTLPKKWTPGLRVDLRWAVANWSNENKEETGRRVYTSITHTIFHATVPVEPYETPDGVFAHFYPNGGARVVATLAQSDGLHNSSRSAVPKEGAPQAQGVKVPAIFSETELSQMARENSARTRHGVGNE